MHGARVDRVGKGAAADSQRQARSRPSPCRACSERLDPASEPCDETERLLLNICRLFPGREIGLLDDFFAPGGPLAAGCQAACAVSSAVRAPIATLLREPTIAQLAAALRRSDARPTSQLVAITPPEGGNTSAFVLFPGGAIHDGMLLDPGAYLVSFARMLAPEYAVYGVTLDNLGARRRSPTPFEPPPTGCCPS